jgi:hypothetical protein
MPYDAPVTLKEVIPYILGIILIAAILFFIFYAIKRKKNNQPIFVLPKKPKEPAHVVALRELDELKKKKSGSRVKQNNITARLPKRCGNTLKIDLRFRLWNKLQMKPLKVSENRKVC